MRNAFAGLTSAAVLIIIWSVCARAAEPGGAVKAAVFLNAKIQFADEMFQQCEDADPANIADYLQLFAAYHDDLTKSLEARINTIIGDEGRRTGNDFYLLLGNNMNEAEKTVNAERAKDPSGFIGVCRGLHISLERHTSIFSTIPRTIP